MALDADAGRVDPASGDGSSLADAAGPAADASSDAGGPVLAAGLRVVVDNPSSGTLLRDFPVRVLLDTRALIAMGRLSSDCSSLRVFGGVGCTEARSFFVAEHSCNDSATEIWVRIPLLPAGAREVLAFTVDGASGEPADGRRVFPFFDGFGGSSLDRANWIPRGTGAVSVSGGALQSQGILLLESVPKAVTAGQSIVTVRLAALGMYDTDLEIGAGAVSDSAPLTVWAPGRTWDGVSFVSHDIATYGFDGPANSPCDDLGGSSLPPSIGSPWVDHPPSSASFLTVEFGYANQGGVTQAWLRTSRGASLGYTSPAGCSLPASLPVLITLDHLADSASPIQRVDFVFVRPTVANEPTSSVLTMSSASCGVVP